MGKKRRGKWPSIWSKWRPDMHSDIRAKAWYDVAPSRHPRRTATASGGRRRGDRRGHRRATSFGCRCRESRSHSALAQMTAPLSHRHPCRLCERSFLAAPFHSEPFSFWRENSNAKFIYCTFIQKSVINVSNLRCWKRRRMIIICLNFSLMINGSPWLTLQYFALISVQRVDKNQKYSK